MTTKILVTCATLDKLPRAGKITDFYNALKTATGIPSTVGGWTSFGKTESFHVYRFGNRKCVGWVADASGKVVPVAVRDGKIVCLPYWPDTHFPKEAKIEHTFTFNQAVDQTYEHSYEASGDLGETYLLEFVNEQQYQMLRYQETANWYKAVMAMVDKGILCSNGKVATVTLLNTLGKGTAAYPTLIEIDDKVTGYILGDGKLIKKDEVLKFQGDGGITFRVSLLHEAPVEKTNKPRASIVDVAKRLTTMRMPRREPMLLDAGAYTCQVIPSDSDKFEKSGLTEAELVRVLKPFVSQMINDHAVVSDMQVSVTVDSGTVIGIAGLVVWDTPLGQMKDELAGIVDDDGRFHENGNEYWRSHKFGDVECVFEIVNFKPVHVVEEPRQESVGAAGVREWIPQVNQFVLVEGEEEVFIIDDFDLYTRSFILRIADSARRHRETTLGGSGLDSRGDRGGYLRVKGDRMRPFTLQY